MTDDTQAPERIWAWEYKGNSPWGTIKHETIAAALAERDALRAKYTTIVGDKIDLRNEMSAVKAERDALRKRVEALEAELAQRDKACAEWAEVSQRNYQQAKKFRQAIVHAKTELAQSAQDVHAIRAEAALHRALQKDAGT